MPTRRVLKGDHNQCPTCDEYFNSSAAFDKHRVPVTLKIPVPRRCLTVPEMEKKGMCLNSGGWWVIKLMSDRVSAPHREPPRRFEALDKA